MTTTEHLDKILAKIDRLLEMAAERSHGPWEVRPKENSRDYLRVRGTILGGRFKIANVCQPIPFGQESSEDDLTRANAAFISSCAGNAEAGWRATKAAIESLQQLYKTTRRYVIDPESPAWLPMQAILSAWPVELLD